MFKRALLATVFTFPYVLPLVPAAAQNTTCATRAPGDNTNACASTAFVHQAIPTPLPTFTSGLPLIGNGTNVPAQGTKSGTSNLFPVVDGTSTNGFCAVFTASGGLSSQNCNSSSGSGVVGSGVQGQVAGYTASGTSVVGVPLECTPIETWGGGTGVSNNTTAYLAAAAAFGSNGGCISFGPGTYAFTTNPNIVYPVGTYSVAIRGSSVDNTILQFTGVNGPTFTMGTNCQTPNTCSPSYHARDMTITTTSAPSGNICLNATFIAPQLTFPPWSDVTNVTCRASVVGSRTTGWAFGVNIRGVSYVKVDGLNALGMPTPSSGPITGGTGSGLLFQGNAPTNEFAVALSISNSNFATNSIGVQLGDWFQGVYMNNDTVAFNTLGLADTVSAPASPGNGALQVVNSEFNNYSNNVSISGQWAGMQLSNNLCILFANSACVVVSNLINSTFTGNVMIGGVAGSIGISYVGASTHNSMISGNIFTGMTEAVVVNTGVNFVTLQSNIYDGNTNNVINAGVVHAGSCTGVVGGTCVAGASP